jgi:hypothetical protein
MSERRAMTDRSLLYRQRASALARQADEVDDFDAQLELMTHALQWIEAAENEEAIARDSTRRSRDEER